MKHLFTILCLMMFAALPCQGQQQDSTHHRLGMQSALGYGCFREPGASPLTYRGIEMMPALTYESVWGCWRADGRLLLTAGAYGNGADVPGIKVYGLMPRIDGHLWRRCATRAGWDFYGGVGLGEVFDLRMFNQLENSRMGLSNMFGLSLHARAERTCGRWRWHGALGFTPVAAMLRPGFAFISNFDRTPESPMKSTFDQYGSYIAGACGLESEIGTALLLGNGNRIEFSYRWHHFTSRTSDANPYRLDQASHTICTNFIFQLK